MPDKVPLVGPLALNESEAVADGALVADEEQPAGAFGVGVELVALCRWMLAWELRLGTCFDVILRMESRDVGCGSG